MVMCTNCAKDCSLCPGTAFVTTPCGLDSCVTGGTSHSSVISFGISKTIMHPELIGPITPLAVTRSSASVSISLSKVGIVYCIALPQTSSLLSVFTVKSLGVKKVVSDLTGFTNIGKFHKYCLVTCNYRLIHSVVTNLAGV
jgi:hypothetical protein